MFKKIFLFLTLGIFCLVPVGCKEPDTAMIAKIIKATTSVAFDRIIDKNPELEDTFHAFAQLNKQIMIDREVNVELAKQLMTDVLGNFPDLDEDAQMIILILFNTIVPMIGLPEEGIIQEPQKTFLIAFYDGIIQAVETKRATRDDIVPPVSWEIWLFSKTLERLGT